MAAAPVARSVTTALSIDARGWVAGAQVAQRASREMAKAAQTGARDAIRAFREQQAAAERAAAVAEKAAQRSAREQTQASRQAAAEAEKAARQQEAASKRAAAEVERAATKQHAAYEKVGTSIGAAGLAVGAGLAFAVSKSMDFEAAMSGAAAATGLSGNALDALRDTAMRAGAATQYSATEAADAITVMSKAGISAQDIMGGGLTGALNLAAAGQLSVADASEIAATAMTQFHLAGSDLPHVADLLAAGAGKAQGSVQDLGLALSYVGPVAAGMGVSIEQTTGAIALLSSQGIIGEKAGTGLRGVLSALVGPSKNAAATMNSLGITLYDAHGKFIGIRGAAEQLHRALGPLSEQQRNTALSTIFGNEQLVAARILYQGGAAAVDSWTKQVNVAGYAAKQAATLTDNLRGDIERLGGAFDTALISSGSSANGVLRGMVQEVTGLVDIYNTLPAPVKAAGTAFGAISSAVGVLGGGLLVAAPRIKATKDALNDMGRVGSVLQRGLSGTAGFLTGPWGIALAGAALGLGFWAQQHAEAVKREEDFRNALDQTTGAITEQAVAMRAQQLQQNGTLDMAKRYGLNLNDVTLAATGNADAHDRLIGRLNAARQAQSAAGRQVMALGAQFGDLNNFVALNATEQGRAFLAAQNTAAGMNTLLTRIDPLAAASDKATQKQRDLAAATGKTADAAGKAGGAASAQAQSQAQLNAQLQDAVPVSESTADAMLIIGRSAKATDKDVQDLAVQIDKWKKQVTDAYGAATDVIGNFSVKAGDSASATADKFAKSYRDTVKQARQFANDVEAATRRGLNPAEVASLLEQGPAKAGPILRAMVADHSGRMIKLANNSRAALAAIGDRVAEQARLTNLAVMSSNDKMTGNLGAAMRISQALAKSGGRATAQALAHELGIGADKVETISKQFGISIASNTKAGTAKAGAAVLGFHSQVNELPTRHDTQFNTPGLPPARKDTQSYFQQILTGPRSKSTLFTTPGLPVATDKVKALRDAILGIRDKNVSISVATGTANKLAHTPAPKAATGGFISGPGGPTEDSIPAWLSNGEYVIKASSVSAYGTELLDAINAGRFADGGVVGSDVTLRGSASLGGAMSAVAAAKTAAAAAAAAASAASSAAVHGGSVGGGVAQWAPLVLRVLGELGQSSSNLAGVLRRIRFESGGNPNAVNLTDSNARAGHPSRGLMQTIPGTFNAYAGPYRGRGITDPLASIYAGLNYALHRYHSIAAIDPLNRPMGYARGGVVGARRPARRFAAGGPVTGGDYSGISSIVQSRVTVTAQDRADRASNVREAQTALTAATKALADGRRKDVKAEADARGAVRTARTSLASAQTAASRRGLSATQRAAARSRVTAATERLDAAERRLAAARRDPNRVKAEDALVKRRQALAQANDALQSTERALASQSRPLATRYAEAAYTQNKITGTFLRNLRTLASRGFGDLARQLTEMGGADAETLAAQAVASTATARKLQTDFTVSARLQAQAQTLPAQLAITSALRTQRNPTIAGLSASTGIATSDLQAAALAMRGSLGRNTNARALLSGLGTNTTAGGFAPVAAGDQIVVQVASTGNPWLDGERALAGAKRVKSVGSSRRF